MPNEYDRKNESGHKDEKSLGQQGPRPDGQKEPGRDSNVPSGSESHRSGSNPGSRPKTSGEESDSE